MNHRTCSRTPIVYGSPGQIAVLLDSITRLMEHEPDEVFGDADVKQAAQRLSHLIACRVPEGSMPGGPGQAP
jgi:hypothetical protein